MITEIIRKHELTVLFEDAELFIQGKEYKYPEKVFGHFEDINVEIVYYDESLWKRVSSIEDIESAIAKTDWVEEVLYEHIDDDIVDFSYKSILEILDQ